MACSAFPTFLSIKWYVFNESNNITKHFLANFNIPGDDQLVIDFVIEESLEEISLVLKRDKSQFTTYHQRGVLNFHKNCILSTIFSSDRQFQEFSVLHMGPKPNQRVAEMFRLSDDRRSIMVEINMELPATSREPAQVLTFFKHLKRISSYRYFDFVSCLDYFHRLLSIFMHRQESSNFDFNPIFSNYILGMFTSSSASTLDSLKSCIVTIVDTVEVVSQSIITIENT
jgi:hypothetical protein